jgi:hypothetical protein
MTISSSQKGSADSGLRLTPQDVWRAVSRESFAVLSHVTPAGAPRSSGVVYAVDGDRMLVAVAKDSWKARHIGTDGLVSVTVPIRRGGLMSMLMPIPPATVSFPAVTSAMNIAIRTRLLRKTYRGRPAVRDLNLTVRGTWSSVTSGPRRRRDDHDPPAGGPAATDPGGPTFAGHDVVRNRERGQSG